jgi:GR25 family glycosyltransferase involved in LPS biosynthesis
MKWPVLAIHLPFKNHYRKIHMKSAFPSEAFVWINGVDSRGWRKEVNDYRKLSSGAIEDLIKSDILDKSCKQHTELWPGEIGCALAHRKAWEWVSSNLKDNKSYAIILEDDIEPTDKYIKNLQKSVELQGGIPSDADVMFLSHDGGFGQPNKKSSSSGRFLSGTGNYGYAINKRGAEAAVKMQFPMKYACDIQWRDKNSMYVIKSPIIKMTSLGRISNIKDVER